MKRSELLKIAKLTREIAEEMVNRGDHGNTAGSRSLAGACGDASAAFCQVVGLLDCFECGTYNGMGHCWVRFPNGEILDITATQFNINRKVYTTTSNSHYVTESRGRKAFRCLGGWADAQWRGRLRRAVEQALEEA